MKTQTVEIEVFNPCKEGLEFRKQYPDFIAAWDNCPRGDWMLWLAKKLKVDLLKLTTAKALCANTVRHLMKDERSINAIDVALRFGNGKATRQELDAAADAAYAAYADTYDTYVAYAAYAADADAYAAYVAYVAADARKENKLKTADICRQILTEEVYKIVKDIKYE